jgi:hypothetical protein
MHAVLMPKQSLNRFILCEHIFFAMVSFSIFVLLVAAQAEHPDQSCLVQKPPERKPQLLAVESGPILKLSPIKIFKPLAKAPDSHRDFLTVAIHFAKVPNSSILFMLPP